MDTMTENSRDTNDYKCLLTSICDWTRPENIAIEYHNLKEIKKINYSDLNDSKKNVEAVLSGVKNYTFIAINYDVKRYCVPALILGILARGCGFINLPSRNERDTCLKLGITFAFSRRLIPDADLVCDLNVHGEIVKLFKYRSIIVSDKNVNEDQFAYAIATSGSTGNPKIVKVLEACIVPNILDLKKILLVSRADKIAQITSLTFDPSVIEIFLSLSSGGTLFVVSNNVMNSPHKLLRLIFEYKVTFVQTTPSLWQYRWSGDEIRNTIFSKESHLKVLLIGGEPFPKIEMFKAVKHPENQTKIFNIYGITEVSCWASINEINLTNFNELDTQIDQNLGKLLSQTIFQVRNKDGDIIRNGEGVLYIGSDSRFCIIDSEESMHLKTPVFRKTGDLVTIKGDDLFYKDRCDRVAKRLGNKVDLTQLERVVSELNFVKNCLALWDEKNHKLYLFIATMDQKNIDDKFVNDLRAREELNNQLRKLPPFYQPDRIKYLNDFQLTTSGKICRRSLLKICRNMVEHCSKEGKSIVDTVEETREVLSQIWKNHLTLTTNYGFLENGGSSITAIQISNELSTALDKEFPELISLLLQNETLAKCTDYVVRKMQCVWQENNIDDTASTPNNTEIRSIKKMKYNFTHSDKISEPNTCVWQKCRGKITGKIPETVSFQLSIKSKLNVEYTRDLKKCVDASPTVFKYSSGAIYTSVASHAGVILTKQLNHLDSGTYEVNLPDRIEASVLVLNEFKGIVGCYDGYVYCLDLTTGQIIWKFKTGDTVKCTAVLSDDEKSVFVGSYDKYFYSISVKDGSEMWKLKESERSISATPRTCARLHSVVFGTLDGSCISLNQTSGQMIWKTKFQDPIFSAPAVLKNGEIIFCSVSGEAKSFSLETGRKNWRYKIDGNVFSHLVVNKNLNSNTEDVIIGCNNKTVYCLAIESNSSTPILKYSVTFECPIFATPYCERNVLVVADTSGNLSLLNASNGEVFTCLKLNGDIFSSPIIAEEFLVVGCRDNNIYVVKINE